MREHRKLMERALRESVVIQLRKRGFKGSFPHFRRPSNHRVDYLSVQFNSAGGSFVIELAAAGPDGKPNGYGRYLSIQKLNVTYFANRLRLGSNPSNGVVDHWFEFGPKSYELSASVPEYAHFVGIAASAVAHLDVQMEAWLEAAANRGLTPS